MSGCQSSGAEGWDAYPQTAGRHLQKQSRELTSWGNSTYPSPHLPEVTPLTTKDKDVHLGYSSTSDHSLRDHNKDTLHSETRINKQTGVRSHHVGCPSEHIRIQINQ